MKLHAQQPEVQSDTTAVSDTLSTAAASSNGLASEVTYTAEDSIKFSVDRNIVFLYGKARVSYEDLELSADYIRLDQKNKRLFASGLRDRNSRYRGRPIFKQGEESPISTDSLVFNFETKKGKSYGSFTEVEGGYISAAQSKKNPYNEISFKDGIYSTCNLPHPHFGIHISKGIVTEKQVISGPAYLVIEDIPIPAILPFGFFPKTNKRSSGFRFPTFGEDATQGFFMRGLGWYFGINDYWDAEVLGTLYSQGSYETNLLARYRKNYKYNGQLNFAYRSTKTGVEGTPSAGTAKDFNLVWSHTQNQSANPGTNFSANVNVGTSSYSRRRGATDAYDYNMATRNTLASSISYGKTFGNGLFNFSSSMSHRQDISTQEVYLELPSFSLNMSTLNPFDSKDRVGEQKWYQRISVGYSATGTNTLTEKEYNIFRKETLGNFRNGIQHNIPVSLNFNVLKYLQFSTGVNYSERWTLQTYEYGLNENQQLVVKDTIEGFRRNYEYGLNSSMSTKFYGMMNFRKGRLLALRHVVTPSVSFNYRPDFSSDRFGFYEDVPGTNQRYSPFQGTVYGGPGAGRAAGIGFSIDNNIEAKVRTKSDTSNATEKIPIIQGLSFAGNYNFLAPEFKLSTISFSGRTAFFKQKLGINFYGVLDPYVLDSVGRRVNTYTFREGRLPRLTSLGFSTGFSLNSSMLQRRQEALANQQNNPNLSQQQQQDLQMIMRNPNAFVDFSVPWNLSASYSFNYSKNDLSSYITNTLNFNGDLSVTPKWKVAFNSGYDFSRNEFSTTQFSIFRDLHCWDMSFTWVPFGLYKSYSFDIRVRASILQDLKLSRRSPWSQINL
ncbi:putative LPS assembly protein LptD [Pedobacter sp. SYSU D00535]|uniref:putative LPS assembly protein LptD n=1 Tax=Pedobacter sp. SYSU D00535 TaxID=2810308 RepID=UPI001F6089AF|nr:putative LPS assembly protein LptD [Pedobacter sp. SYSU D00535]